MLLLTEQTNIRMEAVMSPTKAPILFARGMKKPKKKSPTKGPPAAPKVVVAA